MKTAIIIPALNEEGNIGPLVAETKAHPSFNAGDIVIVVDNGSTDSTAQIAADAGAIVVTESRQGYGYACAAGVTAAQNAIEPQADILLFLDGDYSSLPSELDRLLDPIRADQADLVLGSRTLGNIAAGSMPPHQRFGNWLTSRIMQQIYRIQVTDLGPYRAIRTSLINQLNMSEMTFGWPTEMMVKSARQNARILEVPVTHAPRRSGKSKVSGTIRGSILAAYYILGVTFRYSVKQ